MTVEQEAIYTRYKIDHDEINKHNLKAWQKLYAIQQLAISMLKDHFTKGRYKPDADT